MKDDIVPGLTCRDLTEKAVKLTEASKFWYVVVATGLEYLVESKFGGRVASGTLQECTTQIDAILRYLAVEGED